MSSNSNIAEHSCGCSNDNCTFIQEKENSTWKKYIPALLSFLLLVTGILFEHIINNNFFSGYIRLIWYIAAYIPVGFPVIKEAFEELKNKSFFNEFTLMVIATLGAFFIGEFPEAVAVMLFYSVGELFQDSAVNKAKRNIKALLDIRPDVAYVLKNGKYEKVLPEEVNIGEIIQIKVGEKVPLDGIMLSDSGSFNTSALTGESKPRTIRKGEQVLAGMINLDNVIEMEVEKEYSDSSLAKILEMVQDASSRKAKTELLIRKFAKIYTPVVFFLALAITIFPYFFVETYIFKDWLYRALVFLVISCPCALVISVPLGYFGGIGAASYNGILFKGANYLDLMTKVNTVVMDKTGTLTKGVFEVKDIIVNDFNKQEFIDILSLLESKSNHPVAKAITTYNPNVENSKLKISDINEIPGHGISGYIDGKRILAGNTKLMKLNNIVFDDKIDLIPETTVILSVGDVYKGYVVISDCIKEESVKTIKELHNKGIKTVMLSGDKSSITEKIGAELNIDRVYGDLLPQDKLKYVEELKTNPLNIVAFAGDGINDTPVLALSDIGIAMGGMGADAAIEVADVVIQTDNPYKIVTAINIAKSTKRIVIQNIVLAITIKVLVLSLGAVGIASMWGAVFADVGVALIAILNSVRILKKKF